jgi:hypothetical protein
LAPCFPNAIRVDFGKWLIVRFRLAADAAFLMFLRADALCFADDILFPPRVPGFRTMSVAFCRASAVLILGRRVRFTLTRKFVGEEELREMEKSLYGFDRRYSSTAAAALRPSAIAHTTRD